jgi:hypothetical protein
MPRIELNEFAVRIERAGFDHETDLEPDRQSTLSDQPTISRNRQSLPLPAVEEKSNDAAIWEKP